MNSIAVDAGRLTFAAAKMDAEIIPGLLESIRKATSERREYGKGKKAAGGVGAGKAGMV
jgi:hypothetical protein